MFNTAKNRLLSIDISRGLALIFMVEAHIPTTIGMQLVTLSLVASTLAAPSFLIVSGLSYEFFQRSRLKKIADFRIVYVEFFCKGFLIYMIPLIPYIVGFFALNKYEFHFFHWGIFQIIGVAYVFGLLIPTSAIYKSILIVLIFVFNFFVRYFFQETFSFLIIDKFPFLPWIAYFLFGRLAYEIYNKEYFENNKNLLKISFSFFIISYLLITILNVNFSPSTRDRIPMFLYISSIQFFTLSLLTVFVDRKRLYVKLLSPLANLGKITFTGYYLHNLIIYLILFIVPTYYYNLFPEFSNISILIFIVILLLYFEKFWRNYDYKFGFEWTIRTLTQKVISYVQNIVIIHPTKIS